MTTQVLQKETPASGEKQGETHVKQTPSPILGDRKEHGVVLEGGVVDANELTGNVSETESVQSRRSYADVAKGATGEAESREDSSEMSTPTPAEKSKSSSASPLVEKKAPTQHVPAGDDWQVAMSRSKKRGVKRIDSTELYDGLSAYSSSGSESEDTRTARRIKERRPRLEVEPKYRRASVEPGTLGRVRGQAVRNDLESATRPIEKAREKSIFTELLKSYEGTIKNAKVLGVDVEADAAWVESTKSEVGNGVTPLRADELAADLRERHAALDKTFHGRAYRRVTEAEAVVQLADLRRKSRVARETEKRERRKLDAAAAVPASEKSGDGSADDSERDFSDEYRKFSEFRRRYRAEKEAERQKATGEAPVPNRAEPVVGEAKQSPAGGPAAPIRLDVDEAGEPSSLSSSSDSSESSGEGDSSQHSDGEGRRHRGHTANKKKREQKRRAKTSRSGVAPPSEPPSSSDSSSSGSDSDSSSDSRSRRRRKRESLRRREKEKVRRSSRKGRKGSESEYSRPALKVSAKVPIPEKYSGSDNRAKTLAKWTREVRTYLLSSNIDPDSLAAAGYISGCLKDRASELFSHQVIQDVNEQFLPGKGHRKSPWSWEQIVDLFKRKYVSVTAERDASRRFRELRQWKNNGTYVPVSELALQLEELGEEKHQTTDWELKRTFIDALEPEIAAKTFPLFANDFESVVVTYQMVVNEAITQEQVWMQEQAAKAARAKGANLSNYEAFSSSGVQARILSREGKKNARSGRIQSNKPNFRRRDRDRDDDESPMASSMTTGKGNRQSKNSSKQNGKKKSQLTEKEKRLRNERRSKNQCFDCGDEGHWAGECPKSQSRPKNGAIEVVDESDATEELLDSGSEVEKVADCDEETVSEELEFSETEYWPSSSDDDSEAGNDAHLASVVCLPAELVGIDDLTLASAFTQGEETVFPRSFRVPVTIDGSAGHTATVDSGASTTFMHPATAVLRGIKALKYDKPRTLRLGTKGSRAKINAFCFAELTIGEVTRRQRFEIAQVEDEVLLGRDFLRAHKCSIRFDPDILIVYSRAGAPLKKVREEKLADVKLGAMKPTPPGPSEAEKRTFLRKIEREYSDVLRDDGAPLRAPPYRKVMHSIPFSVPEREEKRKITYKFPERFLSAFDKVCDAHVEAGIWIPATASYADPMIPLMKSDGVTPRPVVDLRRRNLVTKKLQMPVVDQDNIINAVAGSKFVTIMDIEGAFQQIRIVDEDVPKTAFSTPRGIFYSIAAQQGDCNSTVSLHRAVSEMLRGVKGAHHYADDVYACSDSWHAHKELVETILQRFRQHEFYLKKKKFRFCTNERDVLGRRVRDGRISIHESKAESILRLKKPANKKELQKVIGVFGFSSRHIPNYAQILAPLTELTGDVPFRWSKTCEDAFTELKRLVQLNLSLTHIRDDELAPADSRPVHHPDPPKDLVVQNEKKGKYLFLFSDASLTGCGSALCIGENWWTSELVGLQSKKFNPAQANYPTHEAELQGVFEAFKWFESKLLGRKVIVCTDNQALSNFLTAKKLNGRQARIWTYLSAFDFEIEYIKGERNVVADILSRIKDRSEDQHEQISAMNVGGRTKKLPARFKDAIVESDTPSPAKPSRQKMSADEARRQRAERRRERVLADREEAKKNVEDVPQEKERLDGEHQNEMYHAISRGYTDDPYFRDIWDNPNDYSGFVKTAKNLANVLLLYREEKDGKLRLCLPTALLRGRAVREMFLQHGHEVLGHAGAKATHEWMKPRFFWGKMSEDVVEYCKTCRTCQQSKPSTQLPHGKLHTVPSAEAPYERLGVDFQGPLPPSKWGSETATFLMNFVDTLTGECILIPCNETGLTAERCADLWFRFVYPQWGVPKELVSDQDVRWRSQFWRSMCQSLGTTLSMSTAYHPQSNGKVERLHRDLNAVLRQYVDVSQNDWAEAIPFAQHALNSRTSSTTGYSPFELSRLCPPSDLPTVAILSGYPSAEEAMERAYLRLQLAKDAIVSAQVRQTQGANRRRRKDPLSSAEMDAADPSYKGPPELWVSTKNLHATKGTARKLVPLFVGPFRVLRYSPRTSTYTLDLPAVYARKGYANVFHASQVRRAFKSDESKWPRREDNALRLFPLDSLPTMTDAAPAATSGAQPDLIDAHLDENGVLRDSDGKEIEDGASLILDEAANVPLPAGDDPDLNSPSINDDERSAAAPEIVERVVKKLPKIKKTKAKRAATTAAATSGSGDATLTSVAMDVDQPPAFTPPTPNPRFSSDVVMLNEDDISVTGHSSKGDNGVEVVTLFTNRLNRNDKVIIVKVRMDDTSRLSLLDGTRAVKAYLAGFKGTSSISKLPRKFRTTQDEQLAAKDREIEQLRQLAHNAKSEVTKVEEDSEKLRKEIKKRDAQIAELEEDKRDLRQRCRYLENENGKKSEVLENQLRLEQLNGIKSNGVLDTTSKDALASQLFGTRVRSKREVYDEEAQRVRDATPISPYWAQPERPY
ncbi:hypothetical protein Rt10032_c08g3664 [Rhodotorula toruloides]|uniref:RNA-directed DNA polymerase n=1 Tax=Rhodotorula toruloides TaxID=5286 RepID=A0A511KH08_RHOTO|nr:hypothetical protein Rt10032_c08g3664 [Rhodotorula toruloides]